MALDTGAHLIVERWSGPVADGDLEALDATVALLGPYGAALNRLMTRRAQMRMTVAVVAAGDDRSDHTKNLAALDTAIDGLVEFMTNSTDITLGQATLLLLGEAAGSGPDPTATITLHAPYPRRG